MAPAESPIQYTYSRDDEMHPNHGVEGGAPDENSPTSMRTLEAGLHESGGDDTSGDDDDDVTIITLDQDIELGPSDGQTASNWLDGHSLEDRAVLLRELQRVQKASFLHFILLCLIPTILLVVVVVTVMREGANCTSQVANCYAEGRTFSNAFTSQCICDAIDVTNGIN
jgi:hypothetical protein